MEIMNPADNQAIVPRATDQKQHVTVAEKNSISAPLTGWETSQKLGMVLSFQNRTLTM